jgi:adenylosuccinate synthase
MATVVVVGTQWGDEGKGKIVDLLTEHADIVARYQGGHNAGHTVVNDAGQFILHLIPAGVFSPDKSLVIGNGVVVSPDDLIREIQGLTERGLRLKNRFYVSDRAHVIMPWHVVIDQGSEQQAQAGKIGTTGRGIGPTYSAKMARSGIRIGDLFWPDLLATKVEKLLQELNPLMVQRYATPALKGKQICRVYQEYGEQLREYVTDTVTVIQKAHREGANILAEGAQGTHLDIDHGTYPFVTSSSCTAGGACTGLGLGPTQIDAVVGITKAYTTRVGEGPFPTELHGDEGARLQHAGGEVGATTGRSRRCGWFDAVVVRRSVQLNGLSALALTKLDVLDEFDTIKVCTGYRYQNRTLDEFPSQEAVLRECQPIYEELPGWQTATRGITEFKKLPDRARSYIAELEKLVGVEAAIIATGPERSSTIIKDLPF